MICQRPDVRIEGGAGKAVKDADVLAIVGRGFAEKADAEDAARRWRGYVECAFAANRVGADFGDREPGGGLTELGKRAFEEMWGVELVLNDEPLHVLRGSAVAEIPAVERGRECRSRRLPSRELDRTGRAT